MARAAHKHPVLLTMLADGRLHLSGIGMLAPHLTETNCETLLGRATHKSRREIEELVAEIAPRPDVAAAIRKLPVVSKGRAADVAPRTQTALLQAAEAPGEPCIGNAPAPGPAAGTSLGQLRPNTVGASSRERIPLPPRPAVVEPLSPARYGVRFTAGKELHDKLRRLQALMRTTVPDGDLATLIEVAVTEKLERLEAKRFGKTKAPEGTLRRRTRLPLRATSRPRSGGPCTNATASVVVSWTTRGGAATSVGGSNFIIGTSLAVAVTTALARLHCYVQRTTGTSRSASMASSSWTATVASRTR